MIRPVLLFSLYLAIAILATVWAEAAYASSFQALESTPENELLQKLPEEPSDVQARIHMMLGRYAADRDISAAKRHFYLAEDLLNEADLSGRSYLSVQRCWIQVLESQVLIAEQECKNAIDLAEQSQDAWVLAKAYGAKAWFEYQRGNLDQAVRAGRLATRYADQTGNSVTYAIQLNSMGLILRAQGLFEDGLTHFSRGLEVLNLDQSMDVEMYQLMNFNVGLSHADLGDFQLAKDYYEVGLKWARDTQRYAKELTALIYIGIADIELGRPQLTLDQLTRAIARPEMAQNKGYLAFANAVIGDAHAALGNPQEARRFYEVGIGLAALNPNTYEQRRLDAGYARTLLRLGEIEPAREILKQAIAQAEQENSFGYLLESLRTLAEVEEAAENYAASLAAYKRSQELTTEFQRQIVERELALMRVDFEVEEKERELAEARQQAIIRNGFIMFALAIAFIGYLFFSRRIQMQNAQERAAQALELERLVAERTQELQEQIRQVTAAENARVTLERQLAEAEKLRILGQLTGGVAHDFNNLLTVVIGAAELLRDSLVDEEAYQGLLDHILTAAASGADITRALMAYARKQPMKLETVHLNEFLEDRIPLLARTLGGMLDLELVVDTPEPVSVVLDSSQLTTALLNLAINARDAQTNHGSVTVTLRCRDNKWAVIEVADQGKGMTEEQISRAVEPFFTTKPDQGNGLGLSMVFGFSKQLGGDLELSSELGKGTRVAMVLPLAGALSAQVEQIGQTSNTQTSTSTDQIGAA